MSERKVFNKYYPPDFDPSKLAKTVKPKNKQQQVRLMLPMSIQCKTCGEYIHQGKKFNGRKEEVVGESYLNIKIYRLYFRCITCLSEITFKTDPKNRDYIVERGASRNFEPWKQSSAEEELLRAKIAKEEMGDNMKVLENRTEASKREMEIQDAIEEVKELNARAQGFTTDQLINIHIGAAEQLEEEQIEAMAAAAFANKKAGGGAIANKTLPDPIDPSSDIAATSTSASTPNASTTNLTVLKRLPDPVDLTTIDTPPPTGAFDMLAGIEVPDSPNSDGAAPSNPDSINNTTNVSSKPPLAPTPPIAGLVLLKRKHNDDPAAKEERRKEKKQKKAAAAAAEAAAAATPTPPPTGGLAGLLGGAYDDDSD